MAISSGGSSVCARCPAAGSLTKALNRAFLVVYQEFRIPGDFIPFKGKDCSALREQFDERARVLQVNCRKPARAARLAGTLRSLKRLFDVECYPCDKRERARSLQAWARLMSESPGVVRARFQCHDPLWLLRRRTRELTEGWGRRLAAARECLDGGPGAPLNYVPDQQGCLETPKAFGGTMAVDESEYSFDDSLVRRGCAKQKGKLRIVTMQSARVKRVLTPVHRAAYDHISSFGWCVRGDLTAEHLAPLVADRRSGESFISADYSAATDNLNPAAVKAVVEVLAECPELSEEERAVLLGSFTNLRWKGRSGVEHAICRGSMMGNLVSFVVLCLLNKACFDIACDIQYGHGSRRLGRFNGDDCAFAGSRAFFLLWKSVVETYGFVVNESKTSVSDHFIELNSRTFSVRKMKLVAKPVLSFFRVQARHEPGEILSEVLEGISTMRLEVQLWVVNTLMRHEIVTHGVELSAVPTRWARRLLKRAWFRAAVQAPPPIVRRDGIERTVPTSVGPPPLPEFVPLVETASNAVERAHVRRWRGVKTARHTQACDRSECQISCEPFPFSARLVRPARAPSYNRKDWDHPRRLKLHFEWGFVYPTAVLRFLEDRCPQVLASARACQARSYPSDSPRLCVKQSWVFGRYRRGRTPTDFSSVPPPPTLLSGVRVAGDGLTVFSGCWLQRVLR
nr:MAG: hypothetical protein [Botourmiaviridae sp.]